jgi:hypothetical protein
MCNISNAIDITTTQWLNIFIISLTDFYKNKKEKKINLSLLHFEKLFFLISEKT